MISGKVVGKEIDENGNIKVITEYTLTDGSKKTGSVRYNAINFSTDKIEEDIKGHCEGLMRKVWLLKQHQTLIDTDLSQISVEVTSMTTKDKDGNDIVVDDK